MPKIKGGNPGNPFRLFHATFSSFNKPEIRDCIAFWNSFIPNIFYYFYLIKSYVSVGFNLGVKFWGSSDYVKVGGMSVDSR